MQTVFVSNREKLGSTLNEGELVVLFAGQAPKSTADAHYSFKTNKNFFYLTGLTQQNFIVLIHRLKGETISTLLIEKPDYDVEKWYGRKLTKEKAIEISGIETVLFVDGFERHLTQLIYADKVSKVFFDLEKLSWNEPHSSTHIFASTFKEKFMHVPVGSCHPILTQLRMIKSELEIAQIEKAIALTKEGLDSVMTVLKPGVFEYQLEATFSHRIRFNGADGNSFPTIAASGKDAVILHYEENDKAVQDGDLVLLDLGAQYQEYCADISRTYPVSGVFSERQKQIYNIVLKAMDAVITMMKPDVPFVELDKTCKSVLAQELMAIGLIESPEGLSEYYYHGVSHHLGLDVHDLGVRDGVLKPGMVFTVEPGLYIAKEGIGIRLEDDILITEDGHRNLSVAIPKSTEEIEAYMGKR